MSQSAIRWIRLTAAAAAFIGPGVVSSIALATIEPPPAPEPPALDAAPVATVAPETPIVITVSVESPSEPRSPDPVADASEPTDGSRVVEPATQQATGAFVDDPVPDTAEQAGGAPQASKPSESDSTVPSVPALTETDHDEGDRVTETERGSDTDGHEPGSDGHEPGSDGHEPGSDGHEPGSDGHEPGSDGHEPGSDGHEPSSDGHEPSSDGHEPSSDGHEPGSDGHEPGSDGPKGNPYRMTFGVLWYTPSGDPIVQLTPEWRKWFELMAASETGSGKPTSATCTYSEGSNELRCEFQNPGHGSSTDGMVVPARPTATYTVSVTVDPDAPDGWMVTNANGDAYSARELCPRRGEGHSDGSDEGHSDGIDEGHSDGSDEGHSDGIDEGHSDGSDGSGEPKYCEHTVEMHQLEVVVPPATDPPQPATDPPQPATDPPQPATDAPQPANDAPPPVAVRQPTILPAEPPPPPATAVLPASAAASAPVAQKTLPTTGNSVSTTSAIGGLMVALGVILVANTRRRPIG